MRANWLADIPPFSCIRVGPQETKSCYEVKNVDGDWMQGTHLMNHPPILAYFANLFSSKVNQTYQELLDKIAPKGMQKIWIIC